MEPIKMIYFHVSIELYYRFLKNFSPGFGWSLDISRTDLSAIQWDLLQFLFEQKEKRHLSTIRVTFSCTKIGNTESRECSVDTIEKPNAATFILKDHY